MRECLPAYDIVVSDSGYVSIVLSHIGSYGHYKIATAISRGIGVIIIDMLVYKRQYVARFNIPDIGKREIRGFRIAIYILVDCNTILIDKVVIIIQIPIIGHPSIRS